MSARRLLCLCDSPTLKTGFGRVSSNLLTRWRDSGYFDEIGVWGIGYNGFPHSFTGIDIYPSNSATNPDWQSPVNLNNFLGSIPNGFTHLWMMYDLAPIAGMADALREVCKDHKVRSLLYFPVDASLEAPWTKILCPVDVAVAYTGYGRDEARRALSEPLGDKKLDRRRANVAEAIRVLPHGCDTKIYRRLDWEPDEPEARQNSVKSRIRIDTFGGAIEPEDFMVLCVAQNQRRKALHHTLAIFSLLKLRAPELRPKLWMHMNSVDVRGGTDLKLVARQFGLKVGKDVFFADGNFHNGHANISEDTLNALYNAADLLLTTSYGEGWGLPITEAMAAGTPVAGPRHTAIAELLREERGILFGVDGWDVLPGDNSRLRPRPDIEDAVARILAAARAPEEDASSLASYGKRGCLWARGAFLNWDRIATEWLDLFKGESSNVED